MTVRQQLTLRAALRRAALTACALALVAAAWPGAGTAAVVLGAQQIGFRTNQVSRGTADAYRTTASASATVDRLSVFLDPSSQATVLVVGLYDDSLGHPGTLLTQGVSLLSLGGFWNTVAVPPVRVTAGSAYWIAVLTPDGAGLTLKYRTLDRGLPGELSAQRTLTSLPAAWATGNTHKDGPLSGYGTATIDTTPPSVALTAPAAGLLVSGTVTVSAQASDDVGVAGVQFKLDGANLGAEDTAAPYSLTWDTTLAASGTHTLSAVARDTAGNVSTSAPLTVDIENAPTVTITDPAGLVGVAASDPFTVRATSPSAGVAQVEFFRCSDESLGCATGSWVSLGADVAAPYTAAWPLDPDGNRALRAVATDAAGGTGSDVVDVTIDRTPPAAAVTAPASGATVSGTVTVTADASDATSGVARVELQRSPAGAGAWTAIGSAIAPPWQASWASGGVANGDYDLRAAVTDVAGNASVSATVTVTVANAAPADPVAAQVGRWEGPSTWPLVAVNMILQPTGDVLVYDEIVGQQYLWNPALGTLIAAPQGLNIFCSGATQLADGRTIVVGGHIDFNVGRPQTSLFDPFNAAWTSVADMSVGRWYPTATSLPDGRVLAFSGDTITPSSTPPHTPLSISSSSTPEIYDPAANTWTALPSAHLVTPLYPFMFVLPDGRILDAGPDPQTRTLDLGSGTWTGVGTSQIDGGSAVMYRPGKVLKTGKWADPDFVDLPVTASAEVLDMTQPGPAWREVAPMAFPRSYHDLTVLPDGNVLVTGGERTSDGIDPLNGVLEAEIWNAQTETWTTMAPMRVPRLYHSTALLLPDARVLVAGGGRFGSAPDQLSAEVYSPPYLFKGPRPAISSAPSTVDYGTSFSVGTPDASRIASVALVRPGAVTHAFDQNQHYVPLSFAAGSGSLLVHAPTSANVAPPGFYMLFAVDTNGVPSVASFVRLLVPASDVTPPSVQLTAPAGGATLSGTVAVAATANDDVGVAGVQFRLDGADLGPEDTAGPYTVDWDTTGAATGSHILTAVARDAAGNRTTTAPVDVTVQNAAPPPPTVLFGDEAIEPSVDQNQPSSAEAFRTSASASGTLTTLQIYVDAASTATSLVAGLYTDSAGHPDALLTQERLAAVANGAWNAVPVPATAVSAGTTYWVAILAPSGTLRFRDRCCGGGDASEASAQTGLSALPATWATGIVYADGPLSAFGLG